MGSDNAILNLSLKNHRVLDTFIRFIKSSKSLVYAFVSIFRSRSDANLLTICCTERKEVD